MLSVKIQPIFQGKLVRKKNTQVSLNSGNLSVVGIIQLGYCTPFN